MSRPRNIAREREITEHAAHGLCDPQALIEFSEVRAATPDYGDSRLVRLDRDFLHETRDELGDARNYLCWWLQDHAEDERCQEALAALRCVVRAFDLIGG